MEEGRVEEAEAMLGYAYGLRGVVVSGKQLGRTIGFPTANLRLILYYKIRFLSMRK